MYETPLDILAQGILHGDLNQVSQILDNNPYLWDYTDMNGASALHWAAKEGQCAIIEYLIGKGVSVNLKTSLKSHHTPLHYAAAAGHADCLQTLINFNAKIDVCDQKGRTAAHWACMEGHTECLITLMNHGADTEKKDLSGRTPLDIAKERNLTECIDILSRKQATPLTDHDTYSKVSEQIVIKSLGAGPMGKLSRIFDFHAQTVAYLVDDKYPGSENPFSAFRHTPNEILSAYEWLQNNGGNAKHPFTRIPRNIKKNK